MLNAENKSNNNNFAIWMPLSIAIALAVGLLIGRNFGSGGTGAGFGSHSTLEEVTRFIKSKYVDTVNIDKIDETAIDAILKKLDPHSAYIAPSELGSVNESLGGEFVGIGIRFYLLNDTLVVLHVIKDGPSARAGVQPGDKILSVDNESIAGVKIKEEDITKKLRGKAGSQVKVALLRNGGQTLEAFIDRGEIPLVSIDNAYMVDNHTGVIKINRFSNNTYTEFMKALEGMIEKDKLSHLIIDLRGNPGGYLSAATDILDQLFTERKLLVYTNGRTNGRKEYRSTGQPFYNVDKIAVLIDEGSASASEILAGALQDHDRGVIVGRRSFGKGLVQEQYDLSNGGALRLTVARYYTPSGRCIQKSYHEGEGHYSEDLDYRYVHGELDSRDSIKIKDSTRYYTGIGRVVYGGGGILPDVFVPLDKMLKNESFNKAIASMSGSIYNYWLRNLDKLKGFSLSFEEFKNSYTVDNELYKKVLDDAKVTAADAEVEKALKTRLKAELARLIFQGDINAWYKIMYEEDGAFQKAKQYIYDDTWRDK